MIRSGTRLWTLDAQTSQITPVNYEGSGEVYNNSKIWLKKDASGNIFLLLTGKNCQYFNDSSSSFSKANNPFVLPANLQVMDIVEDRRKKRYWVVSRNDFGYWDQATRKYYNHAANTQSDLLIKSMPPHIPVASLFIDTQNRYWIQTGSNSSAGFLCYNGDQNRFTTEATGLHNIGSNGYFEVYGFKQLKDSTPALYGLNCFRAWDQQSFKEFRAPVTHPYGIQFNSVEDVFQSDDGTLWVATDNGLYYTSRVRNNIHIIFSQEKARASISSLFEDSNEDLWIGTWGKGILVLNKSKNGPRVTPLEKINNLGSNTRYIWTICGDTRNQIWIGCNEGSLVQYHLQTQRAVLHQPPIFNGSAIRQIVKDNQGKLWIGLQDGRLFKHAPSPEPVHNNSFKEILSLNGLITRMGFLNDRQLWITVINRGICIVDIHTGKLIQSLTVDKGLPGFIANAREVLPVNDTLCLISGEKAGSLNPQNFRVNYNWFAGTTPSGSIFTLQKDLYNNCWLGGSNGIFKLNTATRTITKFTQQDELITIHNNSYVPERSIQLRSGWLAFGGNQHLVIFNPAEYNNSMAPPRVSITGFQLNGRYLPEDSLSLPGGIAVPYEHRIFSIEFAAINFMQKGSCCEYKLEGLNDDWISLSTPTAINYNFLPNGHYRFLVRAKNELGQYSPATTSLRIYIAPPSGKLPGSIC
ncbi:ligand-binding sensor domain-containing protein [Niabella hibiscisoli]|uniref:ligand-binding sensor domain-containing protein n=1 Tax=Niabella hibiscisoli TaxID=1825928 RepID=UPI001F0FB840|nr:two-component regulator propeller domain-containing protein [Niabella hibiscisoli]MCH5714776.1 hypothetical protein [Niabella hibiscisoli]